jgi:multiple sugar transport system permease protein
MASPTIRTRPGRLTATRPGASRRRWRHRFTVASFMAPVAAGMLVFLVYPMISVVYFSFHRLSLLSPAPQWFGLGNYRYLFVDPGIRKAAANTLWLVLVMVPAQLIFGLGSSMLLTTMRSAASAYRTLFYLPALVPPVAGALGFVYLLKPGTGPVNGLLSRIGIEGPLWFNSVEWAKPSLVLLALWGIGNTMMIFLASLLDVPVSLYEAASLDGANAWQRFRHVTLPSISPVLQFNAITAVIATLQFFTEAAVASAAASGEATVGGGVAGNFGYPQNSTLTYPLWLYLQGFRYNFLGYASAMSVVLFIVAFTAILVLMRRAKAFTGVTQ